MNSALSVAFRLISCLLIASCSTSTPSSWKPRNLQQSICSCSPRSFTLTLDFLQGCLDNTVESNTGISSPTECTIEVGDPDTSTRKLEDIVVLGIAINTFDEKSWNDIVKKKELGSSNKLRDNIRRKLQDEQATTPTIITSITFIELNALGTVINVDDQYMNGNFDNGALINLQSISSTISANIPLENQLELVPSTQVLFMEGLNAAGEEVRGRFVWNYTNSCASNAVAIRQGDELAWIQFTEVEEQIFSICPANENVVPTIVPIDIITPNPTSAKPAVEEGPVPTIPPSQAELGTIKPTFIPSLVTIDTIEPTPLPTSLDPTISPTVLEPTAIPTLAPIDTFEPTSTPASSKPTSTTLTHSPNKSIIMSMSMQQYYVSPQRTEHSIDNILDHFDVIRVGYNGNKHGKSHNHVEILPTINTVSVSVKDHFEVIHIDGDDNKLSKSHKAVERTHTNNFDSVSVTIISKSGKHEKSSKKSSGDDGHVDIEHFRSRSRRSWSDGGGGTGTVKSGKIRASKGDKGGKSLASIGHKSGKTQYVSGSSSERSGKSGKGSGKSGKGSSWW